MAYMVEFVIMVTIAGIELGKPMMASDTGASTSILAMSFMFMSTTSTYVVKILEIISHVKI